MDVNGTRFHLIKGQQEWTTCYRAETLSGESGVAWDQENAALTLQPLLSLFPRGQRDAPLTPDARRGAAVDGYGNWYWIAHDRRRLFWRGSGSSRSLPYWEPASVPEESAAAKSGAFAPATPREPSRTELSGMAVTENHYLVVGDRGDEHGLILIDLHAGAPPMRLRFPLGAPFDPWDIAAAPGGGVWILDRTHKRYWGLDASFRIVTQPAYLAQESPPPPAADLFHPESGEAVLQLPTPSPTGFPLITAGLTGTSGPPDGLLVNPLSIVALPDYTVLILDSPPGAPSSIVYHFAYGQALASFPLEDELDVVTVGEGRRRESLAMAGHDMAYHAGEQALYVLERDGNQAIAWDLALDGSPPALRLRRDFLPAPRGGGRAIVAGVDGMYYDAGGRDSSNDTLVRWTGLHPVDKTRYARSATLLVGQPPAPGESILLFDGKVRDCVWHRLLLDACLPSETGIHVWSRAHNDPALLPNLPFTREPDLYLRGSGAEIPFYYPFAEKETIPPRSGTWETLFQSAQGRYLQLRLEVTGNSRRTPHLRALRVYYPRFSYPANYLPDIFASEGEPGPFLERLLANMEGIYTEIEGKMENAAALFDPRTAPPGALEWLAGWVGLLLDPIWGSLQRRRGEAMAGGSRAPDRRRLFIRFARLLFERRGTPDGILFSLQLLLEPCLEQLLEQLYVAAVDHRSPMRQTLARYDLPLPTPTTTATEFEDLLYDYLRHRPSHVRLVESFLVRQGRGTVAGLPGTEAGTAESSAHHFTVLIPVTLPPEEEAMVRRIINLEKPAHTYFTIRRYWEGFRLGEARLGIDTTLDRSNRFVALLLGRDYLATGYLTTAHPMNVYERVVADRDRLGNLPAL